MKQGKIAKKAKEHEAWKKELKKKNEKWQSLSDKVKHRYLKKILLWYPTSCDTTEKAKIIEQMKKMRKRLRGLVKRFILTLT